MRRLAIVSSALVLCAAVMGPADGVTAAAKPAPLKVFKPILRKLSQVRIPVYLPSWLPKNGTVYPLVYIYNSGKAFEIDLSSDPSSPSTAVTTFWIVGNLNPLHLSKHTQRVRLTGGRIGYIDPNTGTARGLTIAWRQSGQVYMIGKTGPAKDLIKAADSVVRVH